MTELRRTKIVFGRSIPNVEGNSGMVLRWFSLRRHFTFVTVLHLCQSIRFKVTVFRNADIIFSPASPQMHQKKKLISRDTNQYCFCSVICGQNTDNPQSDMIYIVHGLIFNTHKPMKDKTRCLQKLLWHEDRQIIAPRL